MSRPIRVLQITDCHLGTEKGETLLGMDTDESLTAVIDHILAAGEIPELILATGDIALSGHENSYRRFQQHVSRIPARCVWLPGNHDIPDVMREVGGDEWMPRFIEFDGWIICLFNSAVVGQTNGFVEASEIAAGYEVLAQFPNHHYLNCIHHHFVPVGSAWLDEQRLDNFDEALVHVERLDNMRGFLSGHVHQEFETMVSGVKIMTSPSTCVQFLPNSQSFGLDDQNPGYRWLTLNPDGTIESTVHRIDKKLAYDTQSTGYK